MTSMMVHLAAESQGASAPQVIGAPATGGPANKSAAPAAQATTWPRLPILLLLALGAVGACAAVELHLHAQNSSAQLQKEVQRLRDENEALMESARLAQREQQELAHLILDEKSRHRVANLMERSKAFEESAKRSGFEDSPESTEALRGCLSNLLRDLNISSILDVPCRDASWQHLLPGIRNVTYIGGDISIRALETAKHRPENKRAGMEFMLFDAVHFPLKRPFDLVLFRGLIEHQRVQDSLTALLNFKSSGSRFLAANYWPNTPAEANEAAHSLDHAGWYEANLLLPPFSFPEPLASCPDGPEGSRLGLWRLSDLAGVNAQAVQEAQPEKHLRAKAADTSMPRWIHVPRGGPARSIWHRPTFGDGEITLDDLMGMFGSAFAPSRKHLRQREVEDEGNSPFDGLFSDFLETAGPARAAGPGRGQAMLPTQIFRLPNFAAQFR